MVKIIINIEHSRQRVNAQEAHEAIRPTKISTVSVDMENDCNKLYDLIWKRTLASQMADAIIERNNIYRLFK